MPGAANDDSDDTSEQLSVAASDHESFEEDDEEEEAAPEVLALSSLGAHPSSMADASSLAEESIEELRDEPDDNDLDEDNEGRESIQSGEGLSAAPEEITKSTTVLLDEKSVDSISEQEAEAAMRAESAEQDAVIDEAEVDEDEGEEVRSDEVASKDSDSEALVFVEGVVAVTVGNIVAIQLGGDASSSRQQALDKLARPLVAAGHVKGFDPSEHALVMPRTPFKPGTREHWPDKGLHVTVALAGRDLGGGRIDAVGEEAASLDGERVVVSFDPRSAKLLEGVPENDESTGCVYYLALDVSAQTASVMDGLRARLSLPPLDAAHRAHVSVAGVAPCDGDMARFRREWCPPRPAAGLPLPLRALSRQPEAAPQVPAPSSPVARTSSSAEASPSFLEESVVSIEELGDEPDDDDLDEDDDNDAPDAK
jgi:hypothetical protein